MAKLVYHGTSSQIYNMIYNQYDYSFKINSVTNINKNLMIV